jgi:hypothetical protein
MAKAYVNCTVDGAGATTDIDRHGDSGSLVTLTDPGGEFTKQTFALDSSVSDQLLATALTAITIGRRVNVSVDEPPYPAEGPNCYMLLII